MVNCYVCPYCFHREPVVKSKDYFAPMCLNPQCTDQYEESYRAISGVDRHVGPTMTLTRDERHNLFYQCPTCENTKQFTRGCTVCRAPIDEDYLESNAHVVLTVALVGARSSGKTMYMVSLIRALATVAGIQGMSAELDPECEEHFRRKYLAPIREGRAAAATSTERQEPIVLIARSRSGWSTRIIIRDVAGETLEATTGPRPELAYVGNADLTLMLFDPYAVQDLMNKLRGRVSSSDNPMNRREAKTIVNTTITHLIPPYSTTCLALVYGKFDVIHSLAQIPEDGDLASQLLANPGLAFFTDDNMNPHYRVSLEDIDIIDADVRTFMRHLGGKEALNLAEHAYAERPHLLRTFPVSALGQPPHGGHLESPAIAPFRCIDPLQWAMLMKHGMLLFT